MSIPSITQQEYLSIFQKIQNEKGMLIKKGKTFKMMSNRYFTIKGDSLIYYKERNSQKIRGMVNLLNCNYELQKGKKNQDAIKITGSVNAYEIWIIPDTQIELAFYLKYLSMAKSGNFNINISESLDFSQQKSQILTPEKNVKVPSQNQSQKVIKSFKSGELLNASITNYKKDPHKIYTLDVISQLNNNLSIIQTESDIQHIQTTEKNAPNIKEEPQGSKVFLNSSNGKSGIFKQNSLSQQQKPINLINMIDKTKKQAASLFRLEDCNVETADDIPNTSFMNQYEFSYYRLDKQHALYQQPATTRNTSSVGPQKRINMTKFQSRRSKTSRKEYINTYFQKNLKYTSPFGGDENFNQIEHSEVNFDIDEGTSSSIDYDQEKLYPARKSLLEFEIEDICNDETIHHKQNKQLTNKRSMKHHFQTTIIQKDKNIDILSFENCKQFYSIYLKINLIIYQIQIDQDEDIDDAPPGLAKESPLLFQQIDFRKEIVRNSYSQFQNNAICIDHYKKVKMNRKFNKPKEVKNVYGYSQETEQSSQQLLTENFAPSSSKHLTKLKEMFKKNQIISNLNDSRLQNSNSVLSIPCYENDLEDIYNDKQIENDDLKQIMPFNERTINSFQLLEDQPFVQKNFVQLDNQIRIKASQMKLPDDISQQYLTFTDTEDCMSLISEQNNIDKQINNYQNNGCFAKNIFQINGRSNPLNFNGCIFDIKKEQIIQNKEYFLLMFSHFVWNSQMKEANHIIASFPDAVVYKVEISINLLLITGQIRYLDSGMAEYSQIIQMIDKKDKIFSQYSELDLKAILCEAHMAIGLLKVLQYKKLSALSSINTAHNYLTQIKKSLDSTKRKVSISDENRNRYLLVDGLFQIGLSLMPSFFSKIFNLLGINIDMKKGISCLTECMEMKQIKSNYARVILFLFYLESENNILQSSNIVKQSLQLQSSSPIFNWLASLYYWKIASVYYIKKKYPIQILFYYYKSSNAVRFIRQAIDQSERNEHQPTFFHFELGWFYLSQLKWEQAVLLFENMIIQGFDFSEIDQTKFNKKLKSSKITLNEKVNQYYQNLIKKYESNPSITKVKIMHKCCIAFMIGICYISFSNSYSNSHSENKKNNNSKNFINEQDETNNMIHMMLSPFSKSDQLNQQNKSNSSTQLPQSCQNSNKSKQSLTNIQSNNVNEQSQQNQDIFYLWCNLALEIYDKLGDSKTLLDIEFCKITKLFSTRVNTFLIKFELLYFVKELSKVSDENLDFSLKQIKKYQESQIKLYQESRQEDNLIEICSAYLLIIGISYIREKFNEIQEISMNSSKLFEYLTSINKKYQYLSHHAFYWLGMIYKKNLMYQQSRQFFELSKSFKTNLFNLSKRIEDNLTLIIKYTKK